MSRANYRKKPTSVVESTGRTGTKKSKPKPKAEGSTTPGRAKRFAKALKSASADAAGLQAVDAAAASDFKAGAAELSNLRQRNQQSSPGRAREIIKNRRA